MEQMVIAEKDGAESTYVGIKICDGPGRHRLVLTRPYHDAGRIVEIPTDRIASVQPVEADSLGDPVTS